MLLREELEHQSHTCCLVGNDLSCDDSSCHAIQNKTSSGRFVAVETCSRCLAQALSLDDVLVALLSNVLHCL